MRSFYEPTQEQLTKLSQPWCASFSGGKDSTSLVTWVEWLRRAGWISVEKPQLVQADTTVEYPVLQAISRELVEILRRHGWECVLVEPAINEKLYNRILGIGNTPIHPGTRSMRWCTRSTKIDPMDRWRAQSSSGLTLTGLRLGESAMRDSKIKKSGCAAGGECGIPGHSERTYSPILHWSTCHVIDWLSGHVVREVAGRMGDVFAITRKLVEIYDVEVDRDVFTWADPVVTAARFGCIGCPAIAAGRDAPRSHVARHGQQHPLNDIYDVWFEARKRQNRCYRKPKAVTGVAGYGPIKIDVRKQLFARVVDIQRRAGVVLITPEDEAFIRQCWADRVYPRGWSEADELTEPPTDMPLFV